MRFKLTPFVFAGVVTSALLVLAGGARAATLIGSSISAEYDSGALGTLFCTSCFLPSTFTVGIGPETELVSGLIGDSGGAGVILFDFSAHQLVATFDTRVDIGINFFSGPVFTLASGTFPTIASVTGLPFANVSESGSQLAINLFTQALGFSEGTQIVVTFADDTSATPLPAALPLFVTGLGALSLLGWRRKKKAAARAA